MKRLLVLIAAVFLILGLAPLPALPKAPLEVARLISEMQPLLKSGSKQDLEKAREKAEQLLKMAERSGKNQDKGLALLLVGGFHLQMREYEQALLYLEKAAPLMERADDPKQKGHAFTLLGTTQERLGKHQGAFHSYHRALQISRSLRDRKEESLALYNIARVHKSRAEYGKAIEYLEGGVVLDRELKDQKSEATKLGALRELHKERANFTLESRVPADCPFPKSTTLRGIIFTGRHSDYRCGDTWYPSWATDGNLYSPWTDGKTDGVDCSSEFGGEAKTGHAVMIGSDPLSLVIRNTSPPKRASAVPYKGRYPCGSLVYNGIWCYGTYCLGPEGKYNHNGFTWNWPNLGPMPGFQISRDYGKTWEQSPLTPEKPLFPEPQRFLGTVKMGAPHFVDFGMNMEHSPDGKAYLLGMGAQDNDPKPRPCIKPGKPGEGFQVVEGCTDDFANANLSWVSADQVYLARVKPSPETINELKSWEFFAGHDHAGQPVWTDRFNGIKPLIEWNNHMGCVTATYVPGLKKFLMCVTDGWPTVAKMTSYILEADVITGPWRMVAYMKDFGQQGYFLNFPSKFISPDGRTLWLCYSTNYSSGWNGVKLDVNPPGGRYGLCLHEIRLLTSAEPHQNSTFALGS